MESILAFGDSNTWGLIPGSKTLQRFPWEERWTGILQQKCESVRIIEEGLCGRTTVFEDELRPGRRGVAALPAILEAQSPLKAVILMLGTNDCKSIYSASPYTIGKGIELCLDEIEKVVPSENILLVSPIALGDEVWREDKDPEFDTRSVAVNRELKNVYRQIAEKRHTTFLAASDIAKADHADEEHLNTEGHRVFAKAVYSALWEMGVI